MKLFQGSAMTGSLPAFLANVYLKIGNVMVRLIAMMRQMKTLTHVVSMTFSLI